MACLRAGKDTESLGAATACVFIDEKAEPNTCGSHLTALNNVPARTRERIGMLPMPMRTVMAEGVEIKDTLFCRGLHLLRFGLAPQFAYQL